jgi:hypothetical protein
MNFIYWLLCIIIGLLPACFIFIRDRKKNIPVKWLPALLRFFTCFLTAALLLAPAFPMQQTEEEKPLLLWLQDNSASMRTALGKDSTGYRKKTEELKARWQKDYHVVAVGFGGDVSRDSVFKYDQKSTNIAAALQSVTEQYRDQNIGAIILSSDGIYNEGLDPLYAPMGAAIPIYSIGLGDSTRPKDIGISRVYANKTVALNSSFEIVADMRAEKLDGLNTTVSVLHNGKSIAQSPVRVDKDRYTASFRFEAKASEKGFQRYSVSVPQVEGEQNTGNNRMDFFVEVIDEQTKVLLLAAAPHPDIAAIKAALEDVPQYKIETRFGADIPADLHTYALVIAHSVPAVNATAAPAFGNIPVWYILGSQSNLAAFNQAQAFLKIAGSNNTNDVLPLINAGFSYFTLPANIREVMAKMPPLQAPYGSYTGNAGGQVLLKQQIGNIATDYPLWIFRNGETPMAVLCGEGIWRWRLYEYKHFGKHETVDELIRQTVSLLSVKKDTRPFRVFMDKYILSDNEAVNIYAELKNDNGELINGPEVKLSLTDSSGKALNYGFERNGNSYRLNIGLLAPGNYSFKGSAQANGKSYSSEGSFVVMSVPLEQLRTNADYELLYKLGQQSGGGFFTYATMSSLTDSLKNNTTVKPVIHTDKTYVQFINLRWLFFVILLFAAAEWLLRKYWNA